MDFGRIPRSHDYDSSLAPVHAGSEILLSRNPPLSPADLSISIGAPQWSIPGYCRRLEDYTKTWNSIEFNTGFYALPEPTQVRAWADTAAADFLFFVKIHQNLSHEFAIWSDVSTLAKRMEFFREAWSGLGEKWGGCFLQLPSTFEPCYLDALEAWLRLWSGPKLFLEFRHAEWFAERQLRGDVARILAIRRVGTVCTDTPGRRDASHGTLTTPDLFVRFLGESLDSDGAPFERDLDRLEKWSERIEFLRLRGLQAVRFFIHTPDHFWVPELSRIFSEKLIKMGYSPRQNGPKGAPGPGEQFSLFPR